MSPEIARVARFLVVGGGLFAVDLALFVGLADGLGLDVWWAQAASVTARTGLGFAAHKWITFRGDTDDRAGTVARQAGAYLVQGAANVPITALVVTGCVWIAGSAVGGKVLAEVVLAVEVYLLYRWFVYRAVTPPRAGSQEGTAIIV